MNNPAPCSHIKKNGSPCQSQRMAGSEFCFFHNPKRAEQRLTAQRAGGLKGRARSLPENTPELPLESVENVRAALAQTLNAVLRGTIDAKIGSTVAYISTVLLKSLEQGQVEERLAALETIFRKHPEPEAQDDPLNLENS